MDISAHTGHQYGQRVSRQRAAPASLVVHCTSPLRTA
jgi:hypothetical protein